MNLIDKVSNALSDSLDYVIDKNRQRAQLNRIDAVMKNETDVLNRAYIALGKQYYKMLEGKAEETDVSQICDTVKSAKLRLKKAKARYEYTLKYGVPALNRRDDLSVACIDEEDGEKTCTKETKDVCKCKEPEVPAAEEEQDITIAYAVPDVKTESVEEKIENAVEALKEKTESVEEKMEAAAEKAEETLQSEE